MLGQIENNRISSTCYSSPIVKVDADVHARQLTQPLRVGCVGQGGPTQPHRSPSQGALSCLESLGTVGPLSSSSSTRLTSNTLHTVLLNMSPNAGRRRSTSPLRKLVLVVGWRGSHEITWMIFSEHSGGEQAAFLLNSPCNIRRSKKAEQIWKRIERKSTKKKGK